MELADAGATFMTHIVNVTQGLVRQNHAVSPDGQRFLTNAVADDPNTLPIAVIPNWKPKP